MNRSVLYEPIRELTGSDDFLVQSDLVLSWMKVPSDHFDDVIQLFTNSPEEQHSSLKVSMFDLLQFMQICRLHGRDQLDALIFKLPTDLRFIGSFSDDEIVAQACAAALSSSFKSILTCLKKPRPAANDIRNLINFASMEEWVIKTLPQVINRYKLHDPNANSLSSYLKEFGDIRLARVLYFLIPNTEPWPELHQCMFADSVKSAGKAFRDLFYEPPCYEKISTHIQATVIRVIMFSLVLKRQEQALAVWKEFLVSRGLVCGHNGSSKGYNSETLKIVDTFRNEKIG